ncbi:MAG TPA: BON domain-containing protein [Acidobacteriaceae bacterium]
MISYFSKLIEFKAGWRAAVLVAATLGLTAAAVAQNEPDPAAQNEAPVTAQAPAKGPKTIPDAQVEANVLSALAGAPSLADQPINTTTTYGTVTLSGTVKDEASKKLAAQLASTSLGVLKVVDELTVGDIGAAAGQPVAEGAAPLPNSAPAVNENAQQQTEQGMAPAQSQDQAQGPDQGPAQGYPQQQGPGNQQANQPQYAPQPGYRNPHCPPLYTPDGRPYPPPPGCETGNAYAPAYPGRYPGQQPYPSQTGGKQVTVPAGQRVQIRVSQGMDGKHTKVGTTFNGILMNDVIAGGAVALPRGSEVTGTVVDAKTAGGLTGSGALALQLTSISFGGQQYPLTSEVWGIKGPSKTGNTVGNAVGLGAMGAIIGAVAGGGPGAAIGAVAGGGVGLAASAGSQGPQAFVHPESLVSFTTAEPITVTTVGQEELNRLASAAPGAAPRMYYRPRPGVYYRPYYYQYPW